MLSAKIMWVLGKVVTGFVGKAAYFTVISLYFTAPPAGEGWKELNFVSWIDNRGLWTPQQTTSTHPRRGLLGVV